MLNAENVKVNQTHSKALAPSSGHFPAGSSRDSSLCYWGVFLAAVAPGLLFRGFWSGGSKL